MAILPEHGTALNTKYRIKITNSLNEDGEIKDHLLDDFLGESQFRRIHENNLWNGFIMALRNVEYLD
ncbi:hypothetical protein HZS_2044 [Henneguya salminicola]|nr:hypothetical protein HZS_2044 [Henneguya salminicola]